MLRVRGAGCLFVFAGAFLLVQSTSFTTIALRCIYAATKLNDIKKHPEDQVGNPRLALMISRRDSPPCPPGTTSY